MLLKNYIQNHEANNNKCLYTFGEGTTEKVVIMRSGYSSRIFDISNVPIPEPVPPPSE